MVKSKLAELKSDFSDFNSEIISLIQKIDDNKINEQLSQVIDYEDRIEVRIKSSINNFPIEFFFWRKETESSNGLSVFFQVLERILKSKLLTTKMS